MTTSKRSPRISSCGGAATRLGLCAGLTGCLLLPAAARPQRATHAAAVVAQARPGPRGNRPHAHAGEVLQKYRGMTPTQQEKALASDPEFQQLPPQQQQQLRHRLQQFNSLPPERQEQVLHRMQQFEQLTPEQRQRARALQKRIQAIPPERRVPMRIALRNLRQMSPEEQQKVLNSDEFKSRFDANQRDILNGMLQLPIGPGAKPEPQQDSAPQNPGPH